MDFLAYLFTTDVKILVALIIVALITLAALAFTEADQEPEVKIYDWTYRDDLGNTYVVTSAAIEDNWDLLIRDHGLSAKYILDHVFLADSKRVL